MQSIWRARVEAARQLASKPDVTMWDLIDAGPAGVGMPPSSSSRPGPNQPAMSDGDRSLRARLEQAHELRLQLGYLTPATSAREVTDTTLAADEMLRFVSDLGDRNLVSTYLSPVGSTRALAKFCRAAAVPPPLPVWRGPVETDDSLLADGLGVTVEDEDEAAVVVGVPCLTGGGSSEPLPRRLQSVVLAAPTDEPVTGVTESESVVPETCPNCDGVRLRLEVADLVADSASWSCMECGLTFERAT
jgi:hypothetical protein